MSVLSLSHLGLANQKMKLVVQAQNPVMFSFFGRVAGKIIVEFQSFYFQYSAHHGLTVS